MRKRNGQFDKKYSIEEVKQIFASDGCELLDSYYKNVLTPVRYRCSCGNESKISLDHFMNGSRCVECGREKQRAANRVYDFDFIKSEFEKAGFDVLSTEYVNNKTPIEYICEHGHRSSNTWANFRKGRRCKFCAKTGKNNPRYDPDREALANREKFRRLCRTLVRRTLNLSKKDKLRRSEELLGYTHEDLMSHLQSQVDRLKLESWSVDHIFPIKAFVDFGIDDVALINSLDNLRPMSIEENLKKNDSYDEQEFKDYLESKGVVCG